MWKRMALSFIPVAKWFAAFAIAGAFLTIPAFAAGAPSVQVTIKGSLNTTLSTGDFAHPVMRVTSNGQYTPKLEFTSPMIGESFVYEGEIGFYFDKNAKPGTYPFKFPWYAFVCDYVLQGDENNSACSRYDKGIKGALKLTHVGDYFSGSFDATSEDGNGHHVHVTGTFKNLVTGKH